MTAGWILSIVAVLQAAIFATVIMQTLWAVAVMYFLRVCRYHEDLYDAEDARKKAGPR